MKRIGNLVSCQPIGSNSWVKQMRLPKHPDARILQFRAAWPRHRGGRFAGVNVGEEVT